MKTKAVLLSLVLSLTTTISASAEGNAVQAEMNHIANRVQECSTLPYSKVDGQETELTLVSHCPEVKVLTDSAAKIKVAGHIYNASLTPSQDSDGDLYDVQITDAATGESYSLYNTLSFGDVLRAVLGGKVDGIKKVLVTNVNSSSN